jgi:NAD+ synthase (glutamine-hydrolysing)
VKAQKRLHKKYQRCEYGKIAIIRFLLPGPSKMTKLTLALAQINTKLGDVNANLEKHLTMAHDAWKHNADLVIFPELSLTGYVLQDIAATVAQRPVPNDPVFKHLLHASNEIDLVVGFVEEDERYRYYISAAYLSNGKVSHVHRKVYLPTYGIFDEKRYFASGDRFRAFETKFGRAGILICEDFWHASSPYTLWLDGADLMLFTSASPGRGVTEETLGSAQWVENINRTYAGLFTTFVAHANRVGFEDGLNFWGGSTVFDPDGKQIALAPFNAEGLTIAELDLNQLRRTRTRLPLLRDERSELVLKELQRIAEQ